ncbi:nitrite reductase small subunit NirD [Algivirga pacifica]|uniref:Nitrite reductase small subunit NirD n=1 Tax=Algivirga pacifica TaxID=1162670 RepID=A0ABP9D535_9BACT
MTYDTYNIPKNEKVTSWVFAGNATDFTEEGGECVLIEGEQIAIFNFSSRGEWYASQNICPHKQQAALSRGMIGSEKGEPKVACPFHKKTFSLCTGKNLNGEEAAIKVYPVKVEEGKVYIGWH